MSHLAPTEVVYVTVLSILARSGRSGGHDAHETRLPSFPLVRRATVQFPQTLVQHPEIDTQLLRQVAAGGDVTAVGDAVVQRRSLEQEVFVQTNLVETQPLKRRPGADIQHGVTSRIVDGQDRAGHSDPNARETREPVRGGGGIVDLEGRLRHNPYAVVGVLRHPRATADGLPRRDIQDFVFGEIPALTYGGAIVVG